MLIVLTYGVYILLGFFGLKLIFLDIPLHTSSYWRGVLYGAGGIGTLLGVSYLYTNYFVFALIGTVIAVVVAFFVKCC